jgi:hypothetical protein
MQITLSDEELTVLAELLRREYQDLREEIYRTENHRFKAELHAKEKLMEALLAKLQPRDTVKTA